MYVVSLFSQICSLTSCNVRLRCLGHVTNLGIGDTMGMITKKAALETTQAIWEYDPSDTNNRVLGGSLDVIAALRTLATKIQASGQHIQEFHKIQCECGIKTPLALILHGNTRWGSAYGMVERGLRLSKVCTQFKHDNKMFTTIFQAINRFVAIADELFGPITVIRKDGRIDKKIHWLAFKFSDQDWARVGDCKAILEVRRSILQCNHVSFISRMQTVSSNSFPQARTYQSTNPSRQSKHYSQIGRTNSIIHNLPSFIRHWKQVWRSSANTTKSSMINLPMCCRYVCVIFTGEYLLTLSFRQLFIHIISYTGLNCIGVVQKLRLRRGKQEINVQKIG